MMRAPTYTPTFTPVEAYHARFTAPSGPTLGNTIGRVLVAGGADLNQMSSIHAAIQAVADDTAGRARALQDKAALTNLVDTHAGLNGGAAVATQPQALDELAKIQTAGQAALGTPGMIAAYDQQIGPALNDAANQITGHALRQAGVERQAVADQELQSAQQAAASAWQDPARFVQGLDSVKAIAASHTGNAENEDDRAAVVRTAVGGAVAKAVGQALAAGEPEFAAHIMGGWGDTLAPAAYQVAVARLGQAAQTQRMASIFGEAAGGNAQTAGAETPPPSPDAIAISAPTGAAVHPIAGGTVTALDGAPDNATVRILHPDGSSTAYGGLGMAAVAPGDQVTPGHVIGSASPVITLAATSPAGDAADAGTLLRSAGGIGAVIGQADTPRSWDISAMRDRIAQRGDLSPEDQTLATNFAERRMTADQAQLAANNADAGRSIVSLFAASPDSIGHAADLPADLAAKMSPTALAQVDEALRRAAQAATTPAPDNAAALRLELWQRQSPGAFAQANLAPLIGSVHPADLAQIAANQASIAAGQDARDPQDRRTAILDAMAQHEVMNATSLPDEALTTIQSRADTLLRLNRVDPGDRATVGNAVADAIQSQIGQS
jgi:murein DD-endopeptidase MepM/ murein hydrolase activator NlpD